MIKNVFTFACLAVLPSLSLAAVTGDPVADGWKSFENSLSQGTYVRGVAGYSFTSYGAGFKLDADGLFANWNKDDTIVGVGGSGASSTYIQVDNNNNHYIAGNFIGKFGGTDATFRLASQEGGATASGGAGVVFIRGQIPDKITQDSGSLTFNPGDNARNSTYGNFPTTDFVQGMWTNNNGVFTWEILLDVTRLQNEYPDFSTSINIGNKAICSVESFVGTATDTLVTLAAIPEPATTGILITGLLGALSFRRRR